MFKRHPVDNPRITYGFGAGSDKWGAVGHLGVDYGDDEGTPIYAPASGFVVWARGEAAAPGNPWEQIPNSGNNGNCIIINHGPDDWATHTLYAHLSSIVVKEGQWVNAGDLIGYMGNTGYSFGSHLHWEMFIDYSEGQYPAGTFYGRVNPLDYFDVVTKVPVAPGSAGGSSTNKTQEDTLSAAEVKEIKDYMAALIVNGYKKGETQYAGVAPIVTVNQREARENAAAIKNLVAALAKVAGGESFDEAKLLAGVKESARVGSLEGTKQAIESIDTQTTVTIKETA